MNQFKNLFENILNNTYLNTINFKWDQLQFSGTTKFSKNNSITFEQFFHINWVILKLYNNPLQWLNFNSRDNYTHYVSTIKMFIDKFIIRLVEYVDSKSTLIPTFPTNKFQIQIASRHGNAAWWWQYTKVHFLMEPGLWSLHKLMKVKFNFQKQIVYSVYTLQPWESTIRLSCKCW